LPARTLRSTRRFKRAPAYFARFLIRSHRSVSLHEFEPGPGRHRDAGLLFLDHHHVTALTGRANGAVSCAEN
jgi:hypothetical protein